jgi:hypothetical protein
MACSCKKKNQVTQSDTNSTKTTTNDVKVQEQQNKRIVDAIMSKLTV